MGGLDRVYSMAAEEPLLGTLAALQPPVAGRRTVRNAQAGLCADHPCALIPLAQIFQSVL